MNVFFLKKYEYPFVVNMFTSLVRDFICSFTLFIRPVYMDNFKLVTNQFVRKRLETNLQ